MIKLRLVAVAAMLTLWAACQCGPSSLCDGIKCVAPLTCSPTTGKCVGGGVGGGAGGGGGSGGGTSDGGTGGGGGASSCNPACTSTTPVCDSASNTCKLCTATAGCSGTTPICDPAGNAGSGRCVTCTATTGCSGATPFCDQSVTAGVCVGCRNFADCPTFGTTCDLASHTCVPEDAGGTGGGSGGGGGGGSGGGGGGTVVFDDAGMTAHCLPFDAGSKACTTECGRGFVCVNGVCQLRGSAGPVQITLRFPVSEDLDLHVVEPVKDAGTCEIWYGNSNTTYDAGIPFPFPIPMPKPCGALGWLDLDSNPACNLDNVNVENVIYPVNQPATSGAYTVRVDFYQNCSATSPVPYEVEVRANGATRYYCGTFLPSQADQGSAGSGRTITQFVIP